MKHKSHDHKRTIPKHHRKTLKKLNCSPLVEGQTPIRDSCFTPELLHKLKNSYTSKARLIKSPFEDRFEIFANTDVEQTTELAKIWP
jgi:hypothetical protein